MRNQCDNASSDPMPGHVKSILFSAHPLRHIIATVLVVLAAYTFTEVAFAQPQCDRSPSIYCDVTWKGSANFYQWLNRRTNRFIPVAKDEYQNQGDVQVWLHMPQMDHASLQDELAHGSRMLILDETTVSSSMYEAANHTQVRSLYSPSVNTASLINGNPNLPVFPADPAIIDQLQLPPESEQWQIAFNHPTPLSRSDGTQHPFYAFTIRSGSGIAYFVRDESLLTNLMFNTLDNKRWIEAALDFLCGERTPCHVRLHEPEERYIPTRPEPDDAPSSNSDWLYRKFKNNLEEFYKTHDESIKKLPWGFILLLIATVWTIIAILTIFPSGRTK